MTIDLDASSFTQGLIDGVWMSAVDGATMPVSNPATGAVITSVPSMGAKETTLAVEAAATALGGWRTRTAKERGAVLRRWFDLMISHREELALLLTCEQGKPLFEARGEITAAASFLEWFSEEAKRHYGEIIPTDRTDRRLLVTREPVGVVAAITPWNFPSAMITRKVAPALAAGCTVVLKPAEDTPLSALALARLAEEAGVPAGVFNVVTGNPIEIGEVLTGSPVVRKLTFTGSTPVGKMLARASADTVKKISLELGGNAPFIVFDDADLDAAVAGAVAAKFRNAGQTCVSANRIYVQDGVHDEFVERFVQTVTDLKVGNGLTDDVTMGPLINKAAVDKVEMFLDDAVAKGARIAIGGGRDENGEMFFAPTVVVDATDTMLSCSEEIFGPIAPVYRFSTEEEAISRANSTRYGLVAYFYATDYRRITRVAEALDFGMVGVNDFSVATEVAPFGGVKESGLGREGSCHGLDEYTEMKYLSVGGQS